MNVQQFISYGSVVIFVSGVVINIIFIYVIRNGTRNSVGQVYKNIMTCFAICNIVFATMEIIAKPAIHIYGTSIAVLSNGIFYGVKPWGFLSLCAFIGMYGVTTALLTLHFVYRYIVVCRAHLIRLFHETTSVAVVTFSVLCWGFSYGFITFICFGASEHYYKYANASIYTKYGVDANELSFFCVFTHEVQGNVTTIHWSSTIGLGMIFIMMISTFALMIVCGFRMYLTLKKSSLSQKSMKMQTQLLKALVVQAVIPFFTSYLSRIAMYTSVVIGLRPLPIYSFTPLIVTIYTVLDPIAIMFFVCDYPHLTDNLRKNLGVCRCFGVGQQVKVTMTKNPPSPTISATKDIR
ncbi:7TM chemoreceptor, partial [Ostertagia ostertagi]